MSTKATKFEVGKKYIHSASKIIRECIADYEKHAVLSPAENNPEYCIPVIINKLWGCFYKEYKPPVVHTAHVYFWRNPYYGVQISAFPVEHSSDYWARGTKILNHQVVTWTEE